MITIVYTPKATTPNKNIGRVFECTNNLLSITYRPWWQTFLDLITEPLGTSWSFAGKCAVATACTRTPIDGQHGSASKSGCRQREFVRKFWRNFRWCRDAWFMFMIFLGGSWKLYGILMMFSLLVQALFFLFFLNIKIRSFWVCGRCFKLLSLSMLPQFLTPKLLTIFLNASQVLWWVPSALCQPLAVPERTWSPPWSFGWEPRGVVEAGIDCWKRPDNRFCRQT